MSKKQDVQMEISCQQNERFTVRRGGSMLVLGLILVVAFGGAAIWRGLDIGLAESRNILYAGVFCVLAGIAVILDYKNHKLEVCGEELHYTAMFGQTVHFRVEEIGSVGMDFLENLKLLSADGRQLARLERGMTNYQTLLRYLKDHHVSMS